MATVSSAHVVLDAAHLTSNGDIQTLRQLAHERPDVLKRGLTLRLLLTFLPAGTEPDLYTDLLRGLGRDHTEHPRLSSHAFVSSNHELSEDEACRRVRRLRLSPLVDPSAQYDQDTDSLTLFLLRQAHRIEGETGSLELVSQLLEPFVDHSEVLRTWMISRLLPLLRLDYEYYPHSGPLLNLEQFERMDGRTAVQSLLSKAAQRSDPGDTQKIGRDLRGLVGPWMYGGSTSKRRKMSHVGGRKSSTIEATVDDRQESIEKPSVKGSWSLVNEWLLDLSTRDFQRTVDAIVHWNGPKDVDCGEWGKDSQSRSDTELGEASCCFTQAAVASMYATNDVELETIVGSHRILQQVASLQGLQEPPDLKRVDTPVESGITRDYLQELSRKQLRHDRLLDPANPLTSVSQPAINLFNLVLSSTYKLLNLGNCKTNSSVAELAFFSDTSTQTEELQKTLYKLKTEKMNDTAWASVRRQILWLHNWELSSTETKSARGIFSKVDKLDLENEVLQAMLDGGCLQLAAEIYCKSVQSPLSAETVENTVLTAALSSYDAATNGNRTRGGIRNASEILSTFAPYFSKSTRLIQIESLLSATHSMSFYSLTLQHGVPFKPVNIRAHKDPLLLIGKILSQNERSYTHLDDLLDIGQNLAAASLPQPTQNVASDKDPETDLEEQKVIARRRVTRMAIEAALAEDDFDTAYSYAVNRLTLPEGLPSLKQNLKAGFLARHDDISWRAAYAAGRFNARSPGRTALRRLEQRMELLSQALLLAPPSVLSEILTVWKDCEKEMTDQMAREAEEEEKWDEKGDRKIPGGFATDARTVIQKPRDPARGALLEEAPMGLFDVARGAAAALSKSTFPLRGARQAGMNSPSKAPHDRSPDTANARSSDDDSMFGVEDAARVRKRDMVSNMVTGGLASGIGWVIGES